MSYASPRSPRVPYPELTTNRIDIADPSTPGMSNSLLADGIQFKSLEFDVDVLDAVFNIPGRYFIKMTVQSLFTRDYSQILLRKYPEKTFSHDYEALTSVTTQKGTEQKPELCTFDDRQFTFRLPEGFCKNDRNHDVYLLLEAYTLPSNGQDMGKKVGEGKVAIYPRTNAPRTNHRVNPGEDMYKHTTVVSLLRTSSRPGKAEMHCGRMRCTFALKEYDAEAENRKKREEAMRRLNALRELEEEEMPVLEQMDNPFMTRTKVARTPEPGHEPQPPPPAVRVQSPVSADGDNQSILLPATPPPSPPPQDSRKITDSPLRDNDKTTYSTNQKWRHTARPGFEQIDVIMHGASSLPYGPLGKIPQPFATAKTKTDTESSRKAKARTHAAAKPTNSPSWEEMVTMELNHNLSGKESLVLAADDSISKRELINYSIPVSRLKPFHQYHVEMVMPAKGHPEGVKMYASIMRKLSSLPVDASSPKYLGLEVFLRGVKYPIQNPIGPLIAVARIVPDYFNYKSDNLLSNPRAAGVHMTTVNFPSPSADIFDVPGRSSHGYPQLSLLGRPDEQPKWNHPYLFCDEKDKATMFTPSAALVIEYYLANSAMTDEFWKIKSPVGFSSLLLDKKVYQQLSEEKAAQGLRVDGIPIMGSELKSSDGRPPIIGMVLKLVTTHQPESLVAMSNLDNLPLMELKEGTAPHTPEVLHIPTPTPEPELEEGEEDDDLTAPGLYLQRVNKDRMPIKDGQLPPYDAVESVLPEYQYIFVDPNQDQGQSTARTTGKFKPAPPSRRIAPMTEPSTRDINDLEATQMSVLDHQMRDLESYRTAVQRMGQDILTLRGQVRTLEATNSKLRLDVNHYDDSRKLLIDAADLDSLAKPEIAARYAALKHKLAQQTTDLKDYKSRVQRLQNELIKKNDKEKDYLKMSHAHASQQELLQRLQDKVQKVRKLEETCKKQEKVIIKLENVLYKLKGKSTGKESALAEANAALTDENNRLRKQIDDMKDQLTRSGMGGGEDLEKLELYQALERAEGRIISLEKQLSDNARSWGKERADMN
ncbi:coiled-coil domain-containing protein 33, partial [Aplysia californica]|uniref:Coiled-coil domain-containing protein 33 n=1 Tax=Aplysia californica TaxID=6500 RepID=A0ABM0ZX73_APLCA